MRLLFIFSLFVTFTTLSFSQTDLPQVIPPSPTVANIMAFEEVPVSQYSGQANIGIPFFSKNIAPNLNFNVGLQYNTSGIKVAERSSWVGTGWSLMAGGMISRTVMDIPDETYHTTADLGSQGIYNNGYFDYTDINSQMSVAEIQEFVWRANRGAHHYDTQPDLYQFNFMGYTGRFVILEDNNGILKSKFISNDSKIKIDITFNNNTNSNEDPLAILSFEVTDTNGYKYVFDKRSQYYSENIFTIRPQSGQLIHKTIENGDSASQYVSSWNLTKVYAPNSSDLLPIELLSIEYHPVIKENYDTVKTTTYNRIVNPDNNIINNSDPAAKSYNNSILLPLSTGGNTYVSADTKKPKKITFRDGATVEFFINSDGHPEYLQLAPDNYNKSGCILNSIIVKNGNNEVVENYNLNHDTTNQNRLFLESLDQKKSSTSVNLPYNFTYFNKEDLPEFHSRNKDLWGYFQEPSGMCDTDTPDDVLTGLLTKIEYPTSGFKELIFEENTFSFIGNKVINPRDIKENYTNVNTGGIINGVINSSNDLNGLNDFIWFYQQGNGACNFNINSNIPLNNSNNPLDDNTNNFKLVLYKATKPSGFNINWNMGDPNVPIYSESDFVNPVYSGEISNGITCRNISEGLYFFKLENSNHTAINNVTTNLNIDITVTKQEYNSTNPSYIKKGGGPRIKRINFKDTDDSVETSVAYDYTLRHDVFEDNQIQPLNAILSSGSYDGHLIHNYDFQQTKPHDFYGGGGSPTTYITTPSRAIISEMTKGSYVGYKSVSVVKTSGNLLFNHDGSLHTDNGFVLHEFTSPIDVPIVPTNYNYPFTPLPDYDYKRGLLKSEVVYSNLNQPLSKTEYTYNDIYDDTIGRYVFFFDTQIQNCVWDQYYSYYGNALINSPDKNIPSMGAPSIYDNCIGASDIDKFFINYTTGRAELIEKKIFDYFYDAQNNQSVTENSKQYFYNNANFQLKEEQSYFEENGVNTQLRTQYYHPIGSANPPNYPTTSIPEIDKLVVLNKINEITGVETFKNGIKLSQTNTLFEEPEPNLVLPSEVQVGKGTSIPETRLEYHRYDSYGNPLEVSKKDGTHIVYIWGYDQEYPVAKIENARYSEIENLPSFGVDFQIPTNLSAIQEQELRSLTNSMVSTYTYQPLVGITSMTDPRGYTMTYHYDAFNRLEHVKDQDGNILSKNEYNYANQNQN